MAKHKQAGKPTRKQLFLAALDIAGLTQELWAEQDGISYQHLYLVLKGERESEPLVGRIDAFIAQQFSSVMSEAVA